MSTASQAPLRDPATQVLREDLGPALVAVDGAAIVEMVVRDYMLTALVHPLGRLHFDQRAQLTAFYDLAHDPGETRDLFFERPPALLRMQALLQDYLELRACRRRYELQ